MYPTPSNRTTNMSFEKVAPIFEAVNEAKKQGKEVYDLLLGQPKHAAPKSFFEGLAKYPTDHVPYDGHRGYEPLREAWAKALSSTASFELAAKDLLITNGATEGLLFALAATCDTGDNVLVFNPSYLNYLGIANLTGVSFLPIDRNIKDGFSTPIEMAEKHLRDKKCKAVLISNPENPTGKVWNESDLRFLKDICVKQGKYQIIDEVYREFVYDGKFPHTAIPWALDCPNVIVTDSLSKQYGLCGARIGCLISGDPKTKRIIESFAAMRLCPSVVEQFAAAHMLLAADKKYTQNVVARIDLSRRAFWEELSQYSEIQGPIPQGGLFSMLNFPVKDAWRFARFLLKNFSIENKTALISPASSFYFNKPDLGQSQARISFTLPPEDMKTVARILGQGSRAFRKIKNTSSVVK